MAKPKKIEAVKGTAEPAFCFRIASVPGCVTGVVPRPEAPPAPPNQRRRHVAYGPRCPCLHASAVEGSRAKRPVAKGGPITPCEGRCRRCQQATRTRVGI